jgi:P-type Ca2+ transporter type 2C
VMRRAPRGRAEHLFEPRRVARAAALGLAALAGPLAVVAIAQLGGAAAGTLRALGFAALIAADLALVFAARGQWHLRDPNRGVRWMVPAVAGVVALTLAVPAARALFGFDLAMPSALLGAVLVGALPVVALGLALRRAPRPARPLQRG